MIKTDKIISLVDDDPTFLSGLKEILWFKGLKVIGVKNRYTALFVIKSKPRTNL